DGEPAFRRICQAVEAARTRVWITVAFVDRDVQMPDDRGSFFDVLDRAGSRGLDVRVLFWREPDLPRLMPGSAHFAGTAAARACRAPGDAPSGAPWPPLPPYSPHKKGWGFAAGGRGERAFVGGTTLARASLVPRGPPPRGGGPSVHVLYLGVGGPASTD